MKIDFSALSVNKELFYMKINYKKGSNILTLANGTTEINSDNIEKMQMKLLKKVMKLEIKK